MGHRGGDHINLVEWRNNLMNAYLSCICSNHMFLGRFSSSPPQTCLPCKGDDCGHSTQDAPRDILAWRCTILNFQIRKSYRGGGGEKQLIWGQLIIAALQFCKATSLGGRCKPHRVSKGASLGKRCHFYVSNHNLIPKVD